MGSETLATLSSGRVLGPYRLLKPLGKGPASEVWLAERIDHLHGVGALKRFALKVRPLPDRDDELEPLRERILSRAVRHPNVVEVVEVERGDGLWYVVMEYVDGLSFERLSADLARKGLVLPLGVTVELGLGVAAGLGAIHGAAGPDGQPIGAVHGDLRPGSVLLDKDGRVRLLEPSLPRPGAEGAPEGDTRDDIASLGALFFELRPSAPEQGGQQLLDGPLGPLLERCLALEPSERPATAAELCAELEAIRGALPAAPGLAALAALLLNGTRPREPVLDPEWAALVRALSGALPEEGAEDLFEVPPEAPVVEELFEEPQPGEPPAVQEQPPGEASAEPAPAPAPAPAPLPAPTPESPPEAAPTPESPPAPPPKGPNTLVPLSEAEADPPRKEEAGAPEPKPTDATERKGLGMGAVLALLGLACLAGLGGALALVFYFSDEKVEPPPQEATASADATAEAPEAPVEAPAEPPPPVEAAALPEGCLDQDGDGVSTCATETTPADCDDQDPARAPGRAEACDGKDNDCDGAVPVSERDADRDRVLACAGDCDDKDAEVNPKATEKVGGKDEDCDGKDRCHPDGDGDGYGDTSALVDGPIGCAAKGLSWRPGDCDDKARDIYPGTREKRGDGKDNDCNGQVDELPADPFLNVSLAPTGSAKRTGKSVTVNVAVTDPEEVCVQVQLMWWTEEGGPDKTLVVNMAPGPSGTMTATVATGTRDPMFYALRCKAGPKQYRDFGSAASPFAVR